MREYPISTLLIWKTKEVIKHRKFIDNYGQDLKLTDFYVPENQHSKLLVLDGQQRLQTLFIGLKGSYCNKELYFDVLSGDARGTGGHPLLLRLQGQGYGSMAMGALQGHRVRH